MRQPGASDLYKDKHWFCCHSRFRCHHVATKVWFAVFAVAFGVRRPRLLAIVSLVAGTSLGLPGDQAQEQTLKMSLLVAWPLDFVRLEEMRHCPEQGLVNSTTVLPSY